MSKQKSVKKQKIEIQKEQLNHKSVEVIKKFRLGIDKNNNPLITIDNILHFMTAEQYDAFLRGCLSIAKKMNPEVDYTKY